MDGSYILCTEKEETSKGYREWDQILSSKDEAVYHMRYLAQSSLHK